MSNKLVAYIYVEFNIMFCGHSMMYKGEKKWILQGKPVLTTGEKKFYQHTVTLGL